jgi:hypothetical protein
LPVFFFLFYIKHTRLYQYQSETRELKLVASGRERETAGTVFFFSTYDFRDLLNAFNAANALVQAWQVRSTLSTESKRTSDVLALTAAAFANSNEPVEIETANETQLTLRIDGQRLELRSATDLLEAIQIPSISLCYRISGNSLAAQNGAFFDVDRQLFAEGAVLSSNSHSKNSHTVEILAQNRLRLSGEVSAKNDIIIDGDLSRGELSQVTSVARRVMNGSPLVSLEKVLLEIAEAPADRTDEAIEADLYAIESLTRDADTLPASLWTKANDVQVGLLLLLGRRDQALLLLGEQAKLMESATDSDWVREYFRFYNAKLHRPSANVAAMGSKRPHASYCFTCPAVDANRHDGSHEATNDKLVDKNVAPAMERSVLKKVEVTSRRSPDSGKVDVTLLLQDQVRARRSDSQTKNFLLTQLALLGEILADERFVDKVLAERLSGHLAERQSAFTESSDGYVRASAALRAIWECYHAIIAANRPLANEQLATKVAQTEALESAIQRAFEQITSETILGLGSHLKLDAELQKCKSRLQDYCSSGFIPFLYYPLDDNTYEKCIHSIEARMRDDIDALKRDYEHHRVDELRSALVSAEKDTRVDFFQQRRRRWVEDSACTALHLTLGNIIRQYGMAHRRIRLSDQQMFPFAKMRGFSLVYRMEEGIDCELHIDWVMSLGTK